MVSEATRRIRADGALRRAADPRHDRQRLAGRPRSRLAAGERPCGEADKERPVLCLLGHLGRRRAGARRQRQRTGANWSRRGRCRALAKPGADRPLRRFVPDMQDPSSARTPARRPQAAPRPCIPSRAALHRWRQRPAGRASELEQALRRADPLRGMEILAGIRLDELRTLCDARLLRLQAMFGDAGGVGELNPRRGGQSRQGFRRTRGSPASAVSGRITPWALSADTPEARPGLERHPFPVVQCLQASRSRSWALSRA